VLTPGDLVALSSRGDATVRTCYPTLLVIIKFRPSDVFLQYFTVCNNSSTEPERNQSLAELGVKNTCNSVNLNNYFFRKNYMGMDYMENTDIENFVRKTPA
jgi:hypothetical protein